MILQERYGGAGFQSNRKTYKNCKDKEGTDTGSCIRKVGITPQHMSNIETGNSTVSLPTLVAIANELEVSVDELLCDTVLKSGAVFSREAQAILDDCNEYEIRFLVDVMKSVKASMRNVKMFEQRIESKNI